MTNRRWEGIVTMPKGTMTIDKLAGMVQQGFTSIGESINNRIDELEKKFTKRFGDLDKRFDGVDAEIAGMRRQLSQAIYQNEFEILERRVATLERKVKVRAK